MTRNNKQKGVSLIITFFIMVIILAMDLSISAILYSELKVVRNIGNSVLAFYAADSGVEKVLYYDRKLLPIEEEQFGSRGLCYMCFSSNPDKCSEDPGGNSGDKSIFCNSCQYVGSDCDPLTCSDCQVGFETELDDEKHYKIRATVAELGEDLFLTIDSTGYYKEDVLRAIEITTQEP